MKMEHIDNLKGIIFDYGGTIDSRGVHWSEIIWDGYCHADVPVSKQDFRDSYVFAERELARTRHILPQHNFYDLLLIKMQIELGNLAELGKLKEAGKLEYDTIAVDNISELERCILSDLGSQGKNKGVPAQADYQYMQFKLVNSLRYLKSLGVNVVLTAWETVRDIVHPDGTSYSQFIPKISLKIVDNICGLCDVVGKILAKQDGTRGIVLEATQSIYAKNQLDSRKGCLVEDFIKNDKKTKKE